MQPVQSPKFSAELPLHSYIQCVVELALEVYSMFSLLLLPPLRARSDLAGWSRSLVHYQPGGLSVHLRRVFVHSIRLAGLFLSLFRRVSYKYKNPKMACRVSFSTSRFSAHPGPIKVVAVAIPTELSSILSFSQQLALHPLSCSLTQQPHPPPSPLHHLLQTP
jgi:hypothetical protein